LGSVAENVIRHVETPVFVVRQKQHEFIDQANLEAPLRMKTILCPVNFTSTANQALKIAASIAARFQAKLIPVCVVEPGSPMQPSDMNDKLNEWIQKDKPVSYSMDLVIRQGHPVEQILSLADQTHADLIVLEAQRADEQAIWPWGNTTELVLRQAPGPVLVIS